MTAAALTWQVYEALVDGEKGGLGMLAALGQRVDLSLEALQQRRHHLTHILNRRE